MVRVVKSCKLIREKNPYLCQLNPLIMAKIQETIRELADHYGRSHEALLPILQGIFENYHYLPAEAMVEVARELDISAAHVYGTATFYSFLDSGHSGKYIIRVCKTITCMMHGKNLIVQALEDVLKIKPGQTTLDGLFTFKETNCLGQCHKGPAMLINDTPYTDLTPEKVSEIINEYRIKEHLPVN